VKEVVFYGLTPAANKDLLALVRENRFRSDLYYRLNVLSVRLPPLRERRDDIPLLAEHYLNRRINEKCDLSNGHSARPPATLASDVLQKLCAYHWPGNVRQLKNVIDRAFAICADGRIAVEDLELDSDADMPPFCSDYKAAKEQFERDYFGNLLAQFGQNSGLALSASGLNRSVFYAKLRKLALHARKPYLGKILKR
jgi:DNA-binding NtrC family response regulator